MANFSALKTSIQNAIKQNGNEEITGDVLQQILLSIVSTMGDGAINTIEQNLSNEALARQGADNTLQSHIDAEAGARQSADGTLQSNINAEALARGNADTQLQNAINAIKANIDNGYVYAGIATPSSTPVSGKVFYIATAAGTYTNFGGQVLTQGINILRFNGSAWSSQQLIGIDDVPTAGSDHLVKSGGVLNSVIQNGPAFDLSAYNAVGGVLATYADLSAALTALNALDAAYKQPGMSFKFVRTSDNNYIQCRLMSDEFTTDTTQWAIAEEGVYVENPEFVYVKTDKDDKILWAIKTDGSIYYGTGVPPQIVEYINNKIAELSLGDIIAFLDDIWQGDKTLQQLLNEKVDKENGKSLIDSEVADSQGVVENPEYMQVETDNEGRLLSGRKTNGNKVENMPIETPAAIIESIDDPEKRLAITIDNDDKVISFRDKDGTLHENSADIKSLNVTDMHFEKDIPQQIKDYVQEYIPEPPTPDEHDEIPYNDLLSIGSKTLKVYNPYKESKQHQYTGQMHFHSWTKFGNSDYPAGFPGEKWEVPYGYSIDAIPAGETNTEKYLWDMPHEKRVAILSALAMAYAWRHKKLGYDFIALSNYAQFQDVTHQPNLSDITYLQTQYPDAYTYFASLYLDGFDVNDFDANGNLKNFHWLCDSYESTTSTLGIQQHIVVHCAPNFSVPYGSGTFKDVMNRVQDYGCIVQWPHPTDIGTYASSEVIATVKKRLRLIEIYDGISIRKYDANGVMTNREAVVSGVILDEPFDDFLVQGNFIFGMAISDERPTYGRTGSSMFVLNPPKNLKNGCVKVFGDNLTSEELFESLLSGNFYASSDSDVSINSVSVADGKYTVNVGIEGVVVEFLKENNIIVKTVTTSAGNTVASYDIDGSEQFVRARIYKLNELPYDANYWYKNKEWMIWTQPLFISKAIL